MIVQVPIESTYGWLLALSNFWLAGISLYSKCPNTQDPPAHLPIVPPTPPHPTQAHLARPTFCMPLASSCLFMPAAFLRVPVWILQRIYVNKYWRKSDFRSEEV